MNLDEAKRYLGDRWVLSPNYRRQAEHSPYWPVDVSKTIRRAVARHKPLVTNIVLLGPTRHAGRGT
jgi:hypothetical protein